MGQGPRPAKQVRVAHGGVGVCDLAVHNLEPLGHCLEMGCGRSHGAGCDGDRCCAQALEGLGRPEATDAMALQQARDSSFTDLLGLIRCRDEPPKFQEPGCSDVVGQLQHLRMIAPQQFSNTIAESIAVMAQIVADAGPSRSSTMIGSSGSRRRRRPSAARRPARARRGCRLWRRRARSGPGSSRVASG